VPFRGASCNTHVKHHISNGVVTPNYLAFWFPACFPPFSALSPFASLCNTHPTIHTTNSISNHITESIHTPFCVQLWNFIDHAVSQSVHAVACTCSTSLLLGYCLRSDLPFIAVFGKYPVSGISGADSVSAREPVIVNSHCSATAGV
jgi:hypothetical protein